MVPGCRSKVGSREMAAPTGQAVGLVWSFVTIATKRNPAEEWTTTTLATIQSAISTWFNFTCFLQVNLLRISCRLDQEMVDKLNEKSSVTSSRPCIVKTDQNKTESFSIN